MPHDTRVCPNCFSANMVFAGATAAYSAFGTSQMYECKDCGYVGPVTVLLDKTQRD